MAQPEPYEDEEPASQDDTPAGPRPVAKPEWLVGAHEALEAEFGHGEDVPGLAPPELRSAIPAPPRQSSGPRPVNPYEGFAGSAAGRAHGSSWVETGYSAPAPPQAQAQPAPEDDRDPDDPFGHGRAREEAAVPGEELAGPETPSAASERTRSAPPTPAPKPWWEPLLAQALTPRGLIVMGVAVIAIIAVMLLFGPKDNSVPLSRIRHNAKQYDGQLVKVRGKVGEVYPVGGGYSFYLLQGRDTIVVFTRSRTPVSNDHVSVSGVISTGVLNGQVRQALLESSP
jgi:hypothetical protein